MCSLTTIESNRFLIKRDRQYGLGKCGDVSISQDINVLKLHCLFCEFDDEKLDTFLYHLRSEHLKLLKSDVSWLGAVQEVEEVVKAENIEADVVEDNKLCLEIEGDPLRTENNATEKEGYSLMQV